MYKRRYVSRIIQDVLVHPVYGLNAVDPSGFPRGDAVIAEMSLQVS
jgi:hypothetical protein